VYHTTRDDLDHPVDKEKKEAKNEEVGRSDEIDEEKTAFKEGDKDDVKDGEEVTKPPSETLEPGKDNAKDKNKENSEASSQSSGLSEDTHAHQPGRGNKVAPMDSTMSFMAKGDFPMEITRHQFMNIKSIRLNPIGDRIALCFGFKPDDPDSLISYEDYMQHAADFNRPGNREVKLKLAFKIQDYDNDEKLDKADLKTYYDAIARNGNMAKQVPKKVRNEVIKKVLTETSSDPKKRFLNFEDFQRVIGTTDFDTTLKLDLNIYDKLKKK
jgi:Ca2+-binding EF-hand superfamily protein